MKPRLALGKILLLQSSCPIPILSPCPTLQHSDTGIQECVGPFLVGSSSSAVFRATAAPSTIHQLRSIALSVDETDPQQSSTGSKCQSPTECKKQSPGGACPVAEEIQLQYMGVQDDGEAISVPIEERSLVSLMDY